MFLGGVRTKRTEKWSRDRKKEGEGERKWLEENENEGRRRETLTDFGFVSTTIYSTNPLADDYSYITLFTFLLHQFAMTIIINSKSYYIYYNKLNQNLYHINSTSKDSKLCIKIGIVHFAINLSIFQVNPCHIIIKHRSIFIPGSIAKLWARGGLVVVSDYQL